MHGGEWSMGSGGELNSRPSWSTKMSVYSFMVFSRYEGGRNTVMSRAACHSFSRKCSDASWGEGTCAITSVLPRRSKKYG